MRQNTFCSICSSRLAALIRGYLIVCLGFGCVCVFRVCLSTPSRSRVEDSSDPGIAFLNVGEGLEASLHPDETFRSELQSGVLRRDGFPSEHRRSFWFFSLRVNKKQKSSRETLSDTFSKTSVFCSICFVCLISRTIIYNDLFLHLAFGLFSLFQYLMLLKMHYAQQMHKANSLHEV